MLKLHQGTCTFREYVNNTSSCGVQQSQPEAAQKRDTNLERELKRHLICNNCFLCQARKNCHAPSKRLTTIVAPLYLKIQLIDTFPSCVLSNYCLSNCHCKQNCLLEMVAGTCQAIWLQGKTSTRRCYSRKHFHFPTV